jgi:predicted Ser/Thr protein kinase
MTPSPPVGSRLEAGTTFSHYRIVETLGAGGMGVVYRAVDERLSRPVAIKVIRHDPADVDRRRRFVREARSASTFNHPNIVTIHEVDSASDVDFIVMELVAGRSLDERLAGRGLPIDEGLAIAEQIAAALDAAHAAGIVHRDIKPANVMVSDSGHVKVLDFGIAKQLVPAASPDAETLIVADVTRPGTVLGSPGYMSPEQAQGRTVDGRSDVFSFGVVVYEMLSGRRPFGGDTPIETVAKLLETDPPPLATVRSDVPAALAALVAGCLEKDRHRRPSAHDLLVQLSAMRRSRSLAATNLGAVLRRPALAASLLIAAAAVAGAGIWWWVSGHEARDARRRLPEALAHAERGDRQAFYRDARALVPLLPDEPRLQQFWINSTIPIAVQSVPAGADVFVRGYSASDDEWIRIGRTPIDSTIVPFGTTRLKVIKEGHAPFDGTLLGLDMHFTLDPVASVPEGMVRVPKGDVTIESVRSTISEFWMDRVEVTNREFKRFVDAGGYRTPEYWKEPFVENDGAIPWDAAIARFLDRTGRPGPSTWELGSYPQGQADYPVAGVSWYEAAAYAAFAGKSLPTAFQWRSAAGFVGLGGVFGDVLLHSNFSVKGPVAVGTTGGISPFGHYDLAGNVKEWCWNESTGGRMILGGGWNEPSYMFADRDAQSPLSRGETYGFRLVRNVEPQPEASYAPVPPLLRDYSVEKPIDDEAFAIVRNLYRYDPMPLNARIERTEDVPDWRRETVILDAAYGDERIIAYVYLPASAQPPYQTIVYFPGGDATLIRSSRELNLTNVDFVVRSGRALVFPVYKGTYERIAATSGPNTARDMTVARVKDLTRVVEYIHTRPDLDANRLGYYGASLGAFNGILISAIEPRIKASVLLGGGLTRFLTPPEVDPLNFAPRVHVPTLMVNGNGDFQNPLTTSQLPLFRLLGVPPDRKRHTLFEGGHMPIQVHDVMREILDWFDRYLGSVTPVADR